MDKLYEEEIVKAFFNKHYHDRILYELSSKKKRLDAISRLCHDYENVLNHNYMQRFSDSDYQYILKTLKMNGAPEKCYVISYNNLIDGRYMNLDETLKVVVGYGMPSLVVCIPGKLAYFEAEQVQGAPPRYIIKK